VLSIASGDDAHSPRDLVLYRKSGAIIALRVVLTPYGRTSWCVQSMAADDTHPVTWCCSQGAPDPRCRPPPQAAAGCLCTGPLPPGKVTQASASAPAWKVRGRGFGTRSDRRILYSKTFVLGAGVIMMYP
jgi:hypothetical protein